MMPAYLLDADAWTGSAVQTLHVGSHTYVTRPTDTPADTIYDGRIVDAGQMTRSMGVADGTHGSVSYGYLELAASDGELDPWLRYGFDGRAFTLRAVGRHRALSTSTVLFKGSFAGLDASDTINGIRLRIRDRLAALDVPLLTERYAGTTISGSDGIPLAEGDETLQDQIKPRIWGKVTNVSGRVVNRFRLLWQFSSLPVAAIAVYDGAAALTLAGDYPTLAALVAATISPGFYGTCLTAGIVRLGGSPVFAVTADVTEGDTASLRSAGQVVIRMLTAIGIPTADRDAATFTALDAFNAAEVGIYLDSETSALTAIQQVLDSIGGSILPTRLGVFQVFGFAVPSGTPVLTLTERDLVSGGAFGLSFSAQSSSDGLPVWGVNLTYGRVYRTMEASEMAGSVPLARRTYLGDATRTATAQNASVKTSHPLATEMSVDTLLTQQADAQAEATRRLALFSVQRDQITFPVTLDRPEVISLDLGQVVAVDFTRFGFTGGKLFRVIGREDDYSRHRASLTLWG
jgi:hypothetical protein